MSLLNYDCLFSIYQDLIKGSDALNNYLEISSLDKRFREMVKKNISGKIIVDIKNPEEGYKLLKINNRILFIIVDDYKNLFSFKTLMDFRNNITKFETKNYNIDLSIFTNLTSLDMGYKSPITDNQIKGLIKLKSLAIRGHFITNKGISGLTNLEDLYLNDCTNITIDCIIKLPKLKFLSVGINFKINDENLTNLTKLKGLSLSRNPCITNKSVSKLTNLRYLKLLQNRIIDDQGISTLTNLETLLIPYNHKVNGSSFHNLKKLKYLDIRRNTYFEIDNLTKLVSLKQLEVSNFHHLTCINDFIDSNNITIARTK